MLMMCFHLFLSQLVKLYLARAVPRDLLRALLVGVVAAVLAADALKKEYIVFTCP